MAFIRMIERDEAGPDLRAWYDRVGNPDGTIDEVMQVHSLNPDSLRTHFELYVSACHKPSPLSRAEREIVASVVSKSNGCAYCLEHHSTGLSRLLPEDRVAIPAQLREGDWSGLTGRERALAAYAEKLTETPSAVTSADADALRNEGLDDRAILDLAQVVAYFAYANRIVLGLGCELESFDRGQLPVGGEQERAEQ